MKNLPKNKFLNQSLAVLIKSIQKEIKESKNAKSKFQKQ